MDITESKLKLKSYCVENGYEKPSYESVKKIEEGVRKYYTVRVNVTGLITAEGEGVSRRIAEYKAAINALNDINVIQNDKNKSQVLDNKENKNVQNESELKVNEENNIQLKVETNGEHLVNGKHEEEVIESVNTLTKDVIEDEELVNGKQEELIEKVEEEVKVNGINTDDKNESNKENFNIENSTFLRSIRNSINGSNSEPKDENSVENLTLDSSDDQNSDKIIDEVLNTNDNEIIKSNSSPKNVSFSEETKTTDNSNNNESKIPIFRPIVKNAVSILLEFCMKKRAALPFYDSRYSEGSFWIKCRIELDSDDGKQEFQGLGCGDSLKAAKLVAAEDVIQQLKDKNLL